MKFDLLTDGQEIKIAILVKLGLFYPLFCLFSSYFFASIIFSNFKQAPGHNHKNMILLLGQWPFNSE